MITTINIGNNINLFYTNFSNIINKMFPNLILNINEISNTIKYISLTDNSNRLIMDMYVFLISENVNDITLQQLIICNNLTITNSEIDFTNFTNSNIGPCVYTYDSNNSQTKNTYWINNTQFNNLNINTGDTDKDTLYKKLYAFSFSSLIMPMDDYEEIKYLWLGFQSYQDSTPLFYLTLTNENNFGVFGIVDTIPNSVNTYFKSVTTQSNTPVTYNLVNLSINSSVICLNNVFIPESLNHEYFPYLYFYVGKDTSSSNYIQLEPNGVEYIKGLNNLIAIVSNPKLTLYQKLIYTILIDNTNFYTLNSIKLVDNQHDVSIDWGDGTPNTIIDANTENVTLNHNFSPSGIYTFTLYYLDLTNPNLISNIALTDKYTTVIDLSKAFELTSLPVSNIFKLSNYDYNNKLNTVKLPPNLVTLNANGFCENRTGLVYLEFPTTNCVISGEWLKNSALDKGNLAQFNYSANLSFIKDINNETNDFYTGNFSDVITINSSVNTDTLYVGNYVTTLTLGGTITVSNITAELDSFNNNNNKTTTLTILNNCNINNTVISNLVKLSNLNISGVTTTLYSLNNLPLLTNLTLSDNITNIGPITYCDSLTGLTLSENVEQVNSQVSNYCNNFTTFTVNSDNTYISSDNGVLYNKDKTTLIKIPYAYVDTTNYNIPNTVTNIGNNSMFTKNSLSLININSNVLSIDNNFMGSAGHINTLSIDSNILSSSVFTSGTIDNLILRENVTALGSTTFANITVSSLTVYDENIVLNTTMFDMNNLMLIKGYVGSTSETFANTNNVTFIPLSFGTNQTKYYITIPSNNYTINNVCSLSESYSQIDWGDNTEPETIYNRESTLTHTYENSGDYTVTITHISPMTIDFSYTNSSVGLFGIATKLDFSLLTNCNTTITNLFNSLNSVSEIIYPPNVISITNTLNGTNNVTSVTLSSALTTLTNSFSNQNYNSLVSFTLPANLTTITNCFNNTNIFKGTTLSINTNNTNGLTITNSFNTCSATLTTLTFGENVISIVNSFMNLLTVNTLTVNASNINLSSVNNILFNNTVTQLILVPGGLSTFTIPNTVTTLLQGCVANNKTYSEIVIPESVTTITYPFYNSLDETKHTTINTLKLLNPYSSMANINKIISTTNEGVTTYLDTANVTNIVGYEHSVVHSQINGYNRYPNCSSYNFTSLGYYNSNIVLGSNYSEPTFLNVSITDDLITEFNTHFNYIVPDKTVYSHLTELLTYLTTNTFDFSNYPYVIFYYIDTTNNLYNYIIYVLDITYNNSSITIDSSNTYNSRKITIDYNIANDTYTNLVDSGSFSIQSIITSTVNTFAVLTYKSLSALLQSDNTNITPTFLKYSVLIQKNTTVEETFIGYIIGSNDTGTNKLFISSNVIRTDDYWLNVDTDSINADNIIHICSYNINNFGNIGTLINDNITSISELVSELKLMRTDKYMFEDNVELVSPIYTLDSYGKVLTQTNYDLITPSSNSYYVILNTISNTEDIKAIINTTQSEYDSLTPETNTLYMIKDNGITNNCKIGAEQVDKIYLGNETVWSKITEQEMQGILPLNFTSDGTPLTNYRIYGSNEKSGVIIHNTSPLVLPIQLNSNAINIDFESPLYENEYTDFEEQKVYKIGNWLDNSLLIKGFYSTPAIQLNTNTNWGVTLSKGVPVPKGGLAPYSSLQNLYLRSSISGLRANIFYLRGETINSTNCISYSTSQATLPLTLSGGTQEVTHIAFNFSLPNFASLEPSALIGKVWIQTNELPSQYHDYMALVSKSTSLPQIVPQIGTNTLSYNYTDRQTPKMMIKGNINTV